MRGALELLRAAADVSIRRACGFASFGIALVMLSLSFDLHLALRAGAGLTSIFCGIVWFLAWRSPRRDVRRTELWAILTAEGLLPMPGPEALRLRALASRMLRDRLVWHAERIALAALAMWACAGAIALGRGFLGG